MTTTPAYSYDQNLLRAADAAHERAQAQHHIDYSVTPHGGLHGPAACVCGKPPFASWRGLLMHIAAEERRAYRAWMEAREAAKVYRQVV